MKSNLPKPTYLQIRRKLLSHSCFVNVLIEELRAKIGLPEETPLNPVQRIEWDQKVIRKIRNRHLDSIRHTPNLSNKNNFEKFYEASEVIRNETYGEVQKELSKFKHLKLDYPLMIDLVLGETGASYTSHGEIFTVHTPQCPINEPGVYIRYNPDTPLRSWLLIVKDAKRFYKDYIETSFDKTLIESNKYKVKRTHLTDYEYNIYTEVEDLLYKQFKSRIDSPSIENAVHIVAKDKKVSDSTIHNIYNRIQNRFRLPSSMLLPQIYS